MRYMAMLLTMVVHRMEFKAVLWVIMGATLGVLLRPMHDAFFLAWFAHTMRSLFVGILKSLFGQICADLLCFLVGTNMDDNKVCVWDQIHAYSFHHNIIAKCLFAMKKKDYTWTQGLLEDKQFRGAWRCNIPKWKLHKLNKSKNIFCN